MPPTKKRARGPTRRNKAGGGRGKEKEGNIPARRGAKEERREEAKREYTHDTGSHEVIEHVGKLC